MKIKYLKKAPRGIPGDVADVPDFQANILIKLKFAEPFGGEPQFEYLKNLNGTPVVDDFGSLVDLHQAVLSPESDVQGLVQDKKPIKPKQKTSK